MSRIKSQISYYDLTGGLNNVNTPDTLNSSPKKTETPDILNVEFFKLGGIKSMEGNTAIGDQQESAVVGGWEYAKGNNKYMVIALRNGSIRLFNEVTEEFDEIYSFAHSSDRVSFCNMNNGVVFTNGIDEPMFFEKGRHQTLSGTVAIADGDTEITGTSTEFTSQLNPGDQIEINNAFGKYTVETVTSDTKITITPAISTHYDTVYYHFYDANNAVSIYSKSEVPQIGSTLYSIDTGTDPYTITTAGTVVIGFDPETNNMAYRDTNNVLQSARRPAIHTDLTVTTTLGPYASENIYLSEIGSCNATLINTDPEGEGSPDKPIRGLAIQFYAGRLWIGGKDGLFYSGVGEYNKWDEYANDAGQIAEVYNDTSDIKALGLYSDYMLIHKEFNTYLLTCTGDSSTISVKPYSNVSCDSQQSWVVSNTKYYVYSRENMDIFPLSQRTIYSDRYLGDAITNKVRNAFQNLRDADADKIFCCTLPRKRWMLFYMPMVDQLGSGYALIFDFQCKAFLVRKVPQEVTIAFNYMNEVYIGTEDGLVLREFSGESFNGEVLEAYYKSPWFDWAGDYYHSFAEFALDLAGEYNQNFYIRTFKDGDSPYEDRIIGNGVLPGTGLIWDGGEDEYPYYIYIYTTPVTEDDVTTYQYVCRIPDTNPEATQDTTYTIDEDVYITLHRDENDLIISKYTIQNKEIEETEYQTITDYFENYSEEGHIFTNDTKWDEDRWVTGDFYSIRMLLPNNVFETFQLEIGTNTLGQSFAVYGYNFRRIETEEAPW